MKCKCKNEMIETCKYKREDFASYVEMTNYWCKKCGRFVKVETSTYPPNFFDWYEPDTIPWQLKPKKPIKMNIIANTINAQKKNMKSTSKYVKCSRCKRNLLKSRHVSICGNCIRWAISKERSSQ